MINTGWGYLQSLNNGSIERVNDGNSSAASSGWVSLAPKIGNLEQLAFCIEQDIGGHFAEWKISEVFALKTQNI